MLGKTDGGGVRQDDRGKTAARRAVRRTLKRTRVPIREDGAIFADMVREEMAVIRVERRRAVRIMRNHWRNGEMGRAAETLCAEAIMGMRR